MRVEDIFEMVGLIDNGTEVIIRKDESFSVLGQGNWYQDHILNFAERTVTSFTWQDDNKLYIDVSEVNA